MNIENIRSEDKSKIEKEDKNFLYHMVPDDMQGNVLHPLNDLKDKYPKLFEKKASKYQDSEYRQQLMQKFISTLECKWNDVIHLTAVRPSDLKKAFDEAHLKVKELKFYQIDPEMLDPSKTVVYLYNDTTPGSPLDIVGYKQEDLNKYSKVREETIDYYKKMIQEGTMPKTFVGIPHVLHKGSIDISNLPVISTLDKEDL